jgi:hypothetical protein
LVARSGWRRTTLVRGPAGRVLRRVAAATQNQPWPHATHVIAAAQFTGGKFAKPTCSRRVRGQLQPLARTPDRERIRIHADNAARDPGQPLHKKSFTASHVEDMAAVPGGDIDQPGVLGAGVVPVIIHWLLICATTDQQRSTPLRMSRESAAGWRDRLLSTACSASQARALIGPTTSRLVGLWLIQASSGGTVPTLRLFGYQPIHQISPRLSYKRAAPW